MKIKKSVLDYFYEICAIPRGSGNTDEIADYCVGIAKELGLWYKKDEFNNYSYDISIGLTYGEIRVTCDTNRRAINISDGYTLIYV